MSLRWLAVAVAGAVALSAAAGADGALVAVGTLTPSAGQGNLVLGLAASGGTVVAADPSALGNGGGELDVFTEPVAGWASESPATTLTDSAAMHGPFAPSISGATIIANDAPTTAPSFEDVFVEPPGGWSGNVEPMARLVAPNGENIGDAVISGGTVVAFAASPNGTVSSLYVFVEPLGGWSGTVEPVATLTDSDGLRLSGPPTVSGGTVFSGAESTPSPSGNVAVQTVDVFSEPTGGWSGTVYQSATLANIAGAPAPDAVSGGMVAAGQSLFREPARGWHGSVKPFAKVFSAPIDTPSAIGAFSGAVAATSTDSLGSAHQCPCRADVWLFTEPAGGWSGTVAAPTAFYAGSETGDLSLALQGRYLFTTGGSTIQVERLTGSFGSRVGPPHVSSPFVSGLASGDPQFSFSLTPAPADPPSTSFTLTLPKGLTFSRNTLRLAHSVTIAGVRGYMLAVRHRALTVRLTEPARTLQVTVRARALIETKTMIGQVRLLIRARAAGRLSYCTPDFAPPTQPVMTPAPPSGSAPAQPAR